ncbi:hypothetical protein NON20_24230 (plasmid) [Synechocystis sp. B12]|nr:hypothetical protein NON20_24230 [Synechocystis sp. B12]
MPSLPLDRPQWYGLKEDKKHQDKQKGWTPLTDDIIDKPENQAVYHAWSTKHSYKPSNSQKTTLKLDRLRILSPIQVGVISFPKAAFYPLKWGHSLYSWLIHPGRISSLFTSTMGQH